MRFRQTSLIAALTAFFVLHAPLCALACLPSLEAAPASAMAHMPDGDAPCHGAPETPEPTGSHDDCACDEAGSAVFLNAEKPLSIDVVVAPLSNVSSIARHDHPRLSSGDAPLETDLPPPDILLLKSTWLL